MATDIAFALTVLAVLSTHLPTALRAFLLTLAVVDDLGAILVIALFFTGDLNPAALGGAFAGLVVFYLLQRFRFCPVDHMAPSRRFSLTWTWKVEGS